MKNIHVIAVWLLAFFYVQATVRKLPQPDDPQEGGIAFFKGTWAEALTLAREENKLIFLDAYATWCSPCKLMQRNVFSHAEAGEFFNAHFINVKVNMERGEGPALARKYGLRAYPTLFFIDAAGDVKLHAEGYRSTRQLIRMGRQALNESE